MYQKHDKPLHREGNRILSSRVQHQRSTQKYQHLGVEGVWFSQCEIFLEYFGPL